MELSPYSSMIYRQLSPWPGDACKSLGENGANDLSVVASITQLV